MGASEASIEITVEGLPGSPVASVNIAEMTVVEGQTVTMECQASGKLATGLWDNYLLIKHPLI